MKSYRYYDFVMAAFVTVLLCSNFIGAAKQASVSLPLFGEVTFGAGVLFFPISYIFGDILTEVYGYGRDRRVVWAGFGALAFASFMAWVVVSLPPAGSEFMKTYQANLEGVFGNSWRIALGSMIAFWCGSFSNSYVMARMKVWMQGRRLWMRTIGSTIFGEGVDSLLFYPLAFWGTGIIPNEALPKVMAAQFVAKVVVEVLFTPVTYAIVGWLKRAEGIDHYDRDTNFTPFTVKV